jgi:hypothetical protein
VVSGQQADLVGCFVVTEFIHMQEFLTTVNPIINNTYANKYNNIFVVKFKTHIKAYWTEHMQFNNKQVYSEGF